VRKRNIILITLFTLFCWGIANAQGVKVTGAIVTNSPTDGYPTHIDSLGMGGFVSLPNNTIRDAIPALRRKKGMLVYITETDMLYQLKGGITNGDWVIFSSGSGSTNSFSWSGSLAAPPSSPTLYLSYYNTTDKKSYIWDGDSWEILSQDGSTGAQGIQGIQGPAGTNGISIVWQGSSATAPSSPQMNWAYYNSTDKKSYVWDGDSWEILSQDGSAGAQGIQGIQGPAGTNGISIVWQGSSVTAPSSPQLNWAYYNSTDKKSYVWDGDSWEILSQDGSAGAQGIQGIQGPAGTNGISIVWQGSSATAPSSPQLNWAYYNSTDKKSYVWDGDSWEILSQDGSTGAQGIQGVQGIQGLQGPAGTNGISIVWQGSSATVPSSPQLNWAYYNSTDKKSYVWDGDSWEILSQDGSTGAQGIQGVQGIQGLQGPAGTNGVSIVWQGSSVTAPSSPQLNWAYYNSTDKKSYVWDGDSWEILSQDGSTGAQGIQGLQGLAGTNGISIAWQGSLASAPTSPQLNWGYYNSTDKKSYIWDGDSWEVLSQDGADGSASLNFNGSRPITLGLSPFTGVNPSTNDLAAWIEHVFYPTQGPTAGLSMSFTNPETGSTVTGTSTTQEMMATGGTISVTLNWTAGRQASTATLSTVVVGGVSQSFSQPAQSASTNGSANVNLTRNSNTTYSNQVTTSDAKTASANVSINFSWRRYYGFMSAPGGVSNGTGFTPSNSDILALSNNGFGSSRGFTSPTLTPSGGQRMVIAYPLAWDPGPSVSAQIWVGGLESSSGFQRQVVSLTNASGGITDYVVYVQLNNTSGNISFTIQ
jgi:hypothetical protein